MATKNDPMPPKLSQIDDLTRSHHRYLTAADLCLYWGEYHVGMGYDHGPTNQLIFNLKKSPLLRGKPGYHYKSAAVQRVANAINQAVTRHGGQFTVVPVPPSKTTGHPEYDDRMLQVAQASVAGTQSVALELVRQTGPYVASHAGGGGHRITPAELSAIYEIPAGIAPPQGVVLVIDDVLTEGAHFRAMKDKIKERFPGTEVVGLMVARSVHSVASPDDFEVL